MKLLYTILVLLVYGTLYSQSGTLLNTEEAQESYILYYDRDNTYLIDNCGGIINLWTYGDNDYHLHPKFLKNGNLFFNTPVIDENKHDLLEVDWEGNVVHRIEEDRSDFWFYYENIELDNGNFLCVARELLSPEEFMEIGFSEEMAQSAQVSDMIVEVTPNGTIVWEWHIKDHVIQERDPSAPNYGKVTDHPELLNLDVLANSVDWNFFESFMINSFDYNAELDQIIISIRKMGEIAIIDHSTNNTQAAGSTGGNSGKGGDILWRWGNPQNYGAGEEEDRYLYYQHNPNWIDKGPHVGKIACYNNGLGRPNTSFNERYSTVPVIDTEVKPDGSYEMESGQYSPDGLILDYSEPSTGTEFYSSYTSGAEFLSNGNVHITVGQRDRMFEINPEGDVVWDFTIDDAQYIYRSEKYSVENPIFNGKDLSVKGQIQTNYNCDLYTATTELADLKVEYKVAADYIEINSPEPLQYFTTDGNGRAIANGTLTEGYNYLDISSYDTSIYFLTFLKDSQNSKSVKFIKI